MTAVRILLKPLDRLAAFLDSGKAAQQPGAVRLRRGLAAVTLVFALLASFRSVDRGGMLSPGAVLLALMAFALYANRGGRFVRDWLPVFLAFLCYGLVAKAVPDLGLQVHYTPQIDVDRALGFGHLPTTWLQSHLYHGKTGPLEIFSLLMYLSHFVAPIALACLIWLRWPGRGFNELLYGIVMVSFLAEIAFLLAPTAPPWLAAEHGYIPAVDPVLKNSLTDLGLNELARAKGDASLYNVVAAVPSLHAAWPLRPARDPEVPPARLALLDAGRAHPRSVLRDRLHGRALRRRHPRRLRLRPGGVVARAVGARRGTLSGSGHAGGAGTRTPRARGLSSNSTGAGSTTASPSTAACRWSRPASSRKRSADHSLHPSACSTLPKAARPSKARSARRLTASMTYAWRRPSSRRFRSPRSAMLLSS